MGSPSSARRKPWRAKRTADGTSAENIPANIAIGTVRPSAKPRSSASFTSPIPMPARVGEGGEKQEERGAEAGGEPFDRRVQHGLARPARSRRRGARSGSGRCGGRCRSPRGRRARRRRTTRRLRPRRARTSRSSAATSSAVDELDSRVAPRDRRAAVAAAATKDEPREHGDVVVPRDLGVARHARRRRVRRSSARAARARRRRSGTTRTASAGKKAMPAAAKAMRLARVTGTAGRSGRTPSGWTACPAGTIVIDGNEVVDRLAEDHLVADHRPVDVRRRSDVDVPGCVDRALEGSR